MTAREKSIYDTFNPYIFAHIPKRTKVLDVGCGVGILGKMLRRDKDPVFIAAVEKETQAGEFAKDSYDKIAILDLEEDKVKLPFEEAFFDVIVCGDVLEHLKDPLVALVKLSRYLSKDGFFLISVPNFAFLSVRLALLFGNLNYAEAGILDRNHLHFFTKKSIIGLLREAKLEPYWVRGYNLVKPRFYFLKALGFLSPGLFSIQFLIKARKENNDG